MGEINFSPEAFLGLSATGIFGTVLALAGLYILQDIIATRYLSPLSSFPGPFWASITRLWIAYQDLTKKEHEELYKLHQKYGPIVRISPTMVLCSDPHSLPVIYHRYADKSDFYVTGSFGKVASVFNIQPHRAHMEARKRIAQPYSFTAIKPMERNIDVRVDEWITRLDVEFAQAGIEFDFAPWATFFAYDVISELAFGKPLGFVKRGADIDNLIKSFHQGLIPFGIMSRLHPVTSWLKKTGIADKLLIPKPGDGTGIGNIMRFRDKLLKQRLEENSKGGKGGRIDLLQNFLNARSDDGSPIDMELIKAETLLVLIAGSDTTATIFQGIIIYILTTPGVCSKLMAEINSAPLSRVPQYNETEKHCPYYVACIKETVRLSPAAPNIFPRVVPSGGLTIGPDQKFVPEGFEIGCNPWVTHRDKSTYGEDAELFRPERWLENPEKVQEWEKLDFGFGYGSRQCLGKSIAMLELYKAPLQFFRTFKPELVSREVKYIASGGVARHVNMVLKLEKRK